MSIFKTGTSAIEVAKKIVVLRDQKVPELKAALEEAKRVVSDLRKNRMLGEDVPEKQITEVVRKKEGIEGDLKGAESAIEHLIELLQGTKAKEIEEEIKKCEQIKMDLSHEEDDIDHAIIVATAALHIAKLRKSSLVGSYFTWNTPEARDAFNNELKRLQGGNKIEPWETRKGNNFERLKYLRSNPVAELVNKEIEKASEGMLASSQA